MAETFTVTDASFSLEITQSPVPAAVMFKSMGCPHCTRMLPVFKETAAESPAGVKFGVADVGESMESARGFGIMGVPTIVLVKDGKAVDRIVGAVTKEKLKTRIRGALL